MSTTTRGPGTSRSRIPTATGSGWARCPSRVDRIGFWANLAGHVDPYETAQQAAVREAREEAGITIDADDLRALTTLHRVEVGGPPVEQRCDFFFEATRWLGEPTVIEPDVEG